jgi:recombination protein RecT
MPAHTTAQTTAQTTARTTAQTTSALERVAGGPRAAAPTPYDLVPQYRAEFALVLPQHVDPGAFVQMARSALKRDPKLADVANRNPASLIHALRDSARLGHLPGTENYYLTPRYGKDPGVLGIEGYRGVIERMYRAGAVESIRVELVCANDGFRFDPGADERPHHSVDWWSDRGDILGAYAYAVLRGGTTSKVVIVGPKEIERAKAASSTADKAFSPWQSDPGAMVLKTAAHRLEPWVPTSSEYLAETLRARAAAERIATETPPAAPAAAEEPAADPVTGEVLEPAVEPTPQPVVEDPPDGMAVGPLVDDDVAGGVAGGEAS